MTLRLKDLSSAITKDKSPSSKSWKEMLRAFWSGKQNTVGAIKEQLVSMRPLPIGRREFEEWSDRIISAACLTASKESQKFALSDMLLHMKPTEDHCDDLYFVKSLRKFAVNETAVDVRKQLYEEKCAREAKEKSDHGKEVLGDVKLPEDASGVVPAAGE